MITGTIAHFRLHDAVMTAIRDEIQSQSDSLIYSPAATYEEYQARLGVIRGLLSAIDIAEATEKDWQK